MTHQGTGQKEFPVRPLYLLQCLASALILALIIYSTRHFPVYQSTIMLGLGLYAVLLWRYPSAWMLVIPALVPSLDLTPISGRVFFNEFDLFLLLTIAAFLLRKEPWVKALKFSGSSWLLVFVLFCWQLYTTLNGLLPLSEITANSFTSYYSEWNAVRIAKGFFVALMLLPGIGQAITRGDNVAKLFSAGMLLSLLCAAMVIVWERSLFTGLLNFNTEYRITGLFSIMATGGAPIDAHLIMTIPFVYLLFLYRKSKYVLTGAGLLLAGLYGVAVTYSRANYPALFLSGLSVAGIWGFQHKAMLEPLKSIGRKNSLTVVLVIGILAVPIFSGQYIQSRFSTVKEDLQGRITHWQRSARIMDNSLTTHLFGKGKGTFPRTYLWHRPDGELPSVASHVRTDNNSYIEMGKSHSGGDLYLKQRFEVNEPGPYRLSIDLKPRIAKTARLLVEVCERILFQSYDECGWVGINTEFDPEKWQTFNKPLDVSKLGTKYLLGSRPVEISILNRGMKDGIYIDNVQITTPSGKQLLKNTGFENGMDNWMLNSGDHLAWHIKNIWYDAYFEGGLVGLSVLLVLFFGILVKIIKRVVERDQLVIPLAAAFAGLIVVGMFDTLFDDPRITLMFYLLIWILFCNNASLPATNHGLAETKEKKD